jgi:hypothetical protein
VRREAEKVVGIGLALSLAISRALFFGVTSYFCKRRGNSSALWQGTALQRFLNFSRPEKRQSMNNKQTNKLRAYQAVELVLETNQTTWAGLPAFVTAAGEFTALIAEIQVLAQAQASREGATNEKGYALAALGDAAFEMAAAVHAYTVVTQNFALEGRVDFSRSTIVYGREASVLARVRDIHAAAAEQLANLADYGVTQAKLTALKKKTDAFEALLAKPREQIASGSAVTQSLEVTFHEADQVLTKRLDKLVFQFKTSAPDFFNAYQSARSVVNLPGSRKTNETPVLAPAPTPQPA